MSKAGPVDTDTGQSRDISWYTRHLKCQT